MEFYEVINNRYSSREYLDRSVENEKIGRIFDAVRKAPTARNKQQWKFYLVHDSARKQRLQSVSKNQAFVGSAPIVIVGVGTETDYVMGSGYSAFVIDLSIAMEHIALAATNEGLATCWIGSFNRKAVKEILNLPDGEEPVQLMALGYPADTKTEHTLKQVDEIVVKVI